MWEENQHPRDGDGKFADKEGGGSNGGSTSGVTERVRRAKELGIPIPQTSDGYIDDSKLKKAIADKQRTKQISKKDIKNKNDFVNFIQQELGVKLENNKDEFLNNKRNILYTKIPKEKQITVLSFLKKNGFFTEEHLHGYYWLGIKPTS